MEDALSDSPRLQKLKFYSRATRNAYVLLTTK